MAAKPRFAKLFEPGRIGKMATKNRMVMLPVTTNYGTEDGYVTERIKDWYEERAKGGVGLIIVETSCVDYPEGKNFICQISIDDDKFIPGLSELAQVIKRHGAKAVVQLHHSGPAALSAITKRQPVGPSGIPIEGFELPRELTVAEIQRIVARFAEGAKRAKKAGFDGVEFHAAHYYLLAHFLSAAWNKRRDAYGGDLRNRARILLEIIQATRKAAGPGFSVWPRINGIQWGYEGGTTVDEAQEVAKMAQMAGADAINVSAWGRERGGAYSTIPEVRGALLHLAEAVKKVVTIPVIAAGRIDPELGERALQEGKADFIGMARALKADPELPRKVATGRLDEIRPCICCFTCGRNLSATTVQEAASLSSSSCEVNAAAGREREYQIRPAEKAQKVLVVGGGPAGMEAARIARQRGHQVTLYEKEQRLGGQLVQAIVPPGKDRIRPFTDYLITQLEKLNVKVVLGKAVTSKVVRDAKPDAVIIATGATTFIPEIPGFDRDNVVTADDVLLGKAEVGERVFIIGGELVGCETADFLTDKGKKVTIARRGPMMATKIPPELRQRLLSRLGEKGVTMLTGVRYEEMTDKGVVITTEKGERQTIEADTVVIAAGAKPNIELFKALEGRVPEIYLAGDCVEPRLIIDAIGDGSRVARLL